MATKLELLKAFEAADAAWAEFVARAFGNRAADARYTSAARGEPGSTLRDLYTARRLALDAWHSAPRS